MPQVNLDQHEMQILQQGLTTIIAQLSRVIKKAQDDQRIELYKVLETETKKVQDLKYKLNSLPQK